MKNFISSSAERIIQAKFISLCPLNRCENVTEKELCIFFINLQHDKNCFVRSTKNVFLILFQSLQKKKVCENNKRRTQ